MEYLEDNLEDWLGEELEVSALHALLMCLTSQAKQGVSKLAGLFSCSTCLELDEHASDTLGMGAVNGAPSVACCICKTLASCHGSLNIGGVLHACTH